MRTAKPKRQVQSAQALCTHCNKLVTLDKNYKARKHKAYPRGPECPGSGK